MGFFGGKNSSESTVVQNEMEIKIEHFIAEEGQALFTLDGSYTQNKNKVSVIVGGVEQFSPFNFEETSTNSITLNEGVPVGVGVTIKYIK